MSKLEISCFHTTQIGADFSKKQWYNIIFSWS